MTFDKLPAGESIFLDANPLVYHFASHPTLGPSCTALVERIENKEVTAFTSTHVLCEAAHRLMILEAAREFGWTSKIVERLRQEPTRIQKLSGFRQAIEKVPLLGIQVVTVPAHLVAVGATLCLQYGLLTNDALLVATMQAQGVAKLASHDSDFDRVPGLTRYAPA